MIVTCEQCQTRFKLDAARIPDTGARVRCSRCKHAFFVLKPGAAARDAAIHALAGAAAVEEPSAPSATQDLDAVAPPPSDNTSATRLMPPPAPPAQMAAEEGPAREPESDWQFNEPLRDVTPPSREARRTTPRKTAPATPDVDTSLDALGSPDSWDILGDASLPPLESVPPAPSGKGVAPARGAGDVVRVSPAMTKAAEASSAEATAIAGPPRRARWRESPQDVAFFAGVWLWIATVAAIALLPHAEVSRAGAIPTPAGITIEGLRGRFLDNAVAGPLFVVSGEWKGAEGAATPGVRLEVVVLGPQGELARAPLGDAPSEARLREAAPEALAREIAGSALARGRPAAAPGVRRVAAVLALATRDVTGLRVEAAGAEALPAAR